jgi:integrase
MIRNPADAVSPPRSTREEIKTFDEEQLRTFLEAARETPYYTLFYTSLFTGLRRSELLGLRWEDVDLDLGGISVNRGLHQVGGKTFFRAPKSSKGRRQVALPPSVCLLLRQHCNSEEAQRTQLGFPQMRRGDLVFARADGTPIPPDILTHAWRKLARKLGFHGIRLHDARHTHATLLLKQGVHPKIVQERLGHATIATTLDTYSHVLPGPQEVAALRFDDLAPDSDVKNPAVPLANR